MGSKEKGMQEMCLSEPLKHALSSIPRRMWWFYGTLDDAKEITARLRQHVFC